MADITVIAGVGEGGVAAAAAAVPPPAALPSSSYPDTFVAAHKFAYFVAQTQGNGRELCRFPDGNESLAHEKADLLDTAVGAANTSPDLLTSVAGQHLYFRATASAELTLFHHRDGEMKGNGAVVTPIPLAPHRTHALAAADDRLLVLAFDPAAAPGAANGRVVAISSNAPLVTDTSATFTASAQRAVDLVDCGLAAALATGMQSGFAAYRNVAAAPATAWYLAYDGGVLVARAVPAPASGPFTQPIERLLAVGNMLFLFTTAGASGARLCCFDGSTTSHVSADGAGITDARLALSFAGRLWVTRAASASAPHTLWCCAGAAATPVPPLGSVPPPKIVTSMVVHLENPLSNSDTPAPAEPHLYLLGTSVGPPNLTMLWRVANVLADDGSAAVPQLCAVAAPPVTFVNPHSLVSLVLPNHHYLAFLAAELQGGVPRWSVAIGTEGPNDGMPTTSHEYAFSQQVLETLAPGASPDLLTALVRTRLNNTDGFLLWRAAHATQGVQPWRIPVVD